MRTPIISSIVNAEQVMVGLMFDMSSLNYLLFTNIAAVRSIVKYFVDDESSVNKNTFVRSISFNVEIIQKSVLLSLVDARIKLEADTTNNIKQLMPLIEDLMMTVKGRPGFNDDETNQLITLTKEIQHLLR